MTDREKLDKETRESLSLIFHDYYEKLWELNNKQPISINHFHICQFELEQKLFHKKAKGYAKKKCKDYLKTKGLRRDSCMACCDCADDYGCKYMKTFVKDSLGELLLME